uniref:PDZ domain-containing protein n=1 Tax=Neogobius melanostomus TaxID=47308 RepID=A0A8C6TNU6_9GOBI
FTKTDQRSFPKPIDSKPLLSQRETPPSGTLQQRGDRRPLSEPFDWAEAPHYDNTGFDAEESALEPSSSSQGNPPLGSKPRSQSAHGRRPLLRQERIVGVPLELDAQTLPYHSSQRPTPSRISPRQTQRPTPAPSPTVKTWTRDPSAGPLPGSWTYHDNQHEQNRKDQLTVSGGNKVTVVMSRSSDRLSPMMRETRSKFKKSQSIDEIDMGSYKVYSIPVDSYSSSIEQQTSLDRPELPGSMEQSSMSRSQSAPMLDDELGFPGHGVNQIHPGQNQKPSIPHKAYHFDQNYNPQVRSADTTLSISISDYFILSSSSIPQHPRLHEPLVQDVLLPPQHLPSQRSRPGFLRRADSLVSSTELALFRRVQEMEPPLYGRALAYSTIMDQSALSNMADSQTQMLHNKRNGRYDDDYSAYQDQKKPMIGYPTKSLTQRRPLSARSYSTETYGASQARPVSARPTMAALLEKMPPDYTLATCPEKQSEPDTIKVRPVVPQKPEDITSKMPPDWRQQLLRHIEAKRLDRSGVLKHNTLTLGMLCHGGGHFNLYNNIKHEPPTPSQQSAILDNDQEGGSAGNQWVPYSLGRRDVPPDNLMKKYHSNQGMSHSNQNVMHTNQVVMHSNQVVSTTHTTHHTNPRPQSARCLLQTKGQKSTDGYQEQLCVRIEKNPGLGFSISGGISGQGNPFKPSDMGIFVTRVQHDGPAASILQPGDKILQANGHNFLNMEHEIAVSLLKSFQRTVDLVLQRDSSTH